MDAVGHRKVWGRMAVLVLHSPIDRTVGVDNAHKLTSARCETNRQ
jgi:hypothetical protein